MSHSSRRRCDRCIHSVDAFGPSIKLNLEGSQRAGTGLGVCVTVLFVLTMVYYLAFRSLNFAQMPYSRMMAATRFDYFLPNNTDVQHYNPENETDIEQRLKHVGKKIEDFLFRNHTSNQTSPLKALSRFHVAFMMKNSNMDRFEYNEKGYGHWEVKQTVSVYNDTLKKNVLQERSIRSHLCSDSELGRLNSTMS